MGDSKKQKQYLTGTVHRLVDGVLESHYAGEAAPDWVTNPKVLTDKNADSAEEPEEPPASTDQTSSAGSDAADDDLTPLKGDALKKIAGDLGLAKNGSLDALRDRIRAKRAEDAPSEDENPQRAALIEKLTAKGIEVTDEMSDAELEALDEEE